MITVSLYLYSEKSSEHPEFVSYSMSATFRQIYGNVINIIL